MQLTQLLKYHAKEARPHPTKTIWTLGQQSLFLWKSLQSKCLQTSREYACVPTDFHAKAISHLLLNSIDRGSVVFGAVDSAGGGSGGALGKFRKLNTENLSLFDPGKPTICELEKISHLRHNSNPPYIPVNFVHK